MTEIPVWLLAIGGGGLVAAAYLASLWWTVQRVTRARRPALFAAVSYLMRAPVTALALFGVASGDALRLLAALASFLVVRAILVRSVRAGVFLASTAGVHAEDR